MFAWLLKKHFFYTNFTINKKNILKTHKKEKVRIHFVSEPCIFVVRERIELSTSGL